MKKLIIAQQNSHVFENRQSTRKNYINNNPKIDNKHDKSGGNKLDFIICNKIYIDRHYRSFTMEQT